MRVVSPGVRAGARTHRGASSASAGSAASGATSAGSVASAASASSVAEAEVAQLRAQVARLEAERAALWWAAGHDELTGLANRRLFAILAPLARRTGRPAAVVVLDLDGFKPINDTLGHQNGDRVLQVVGQRLASWAGEDLMARLSGDEFAAVLTCSHADPEVHWWQPAISALSAAIAEPIPVAGLVVRITASIGVAPAQEGVPLRDLLRRADVAMYHAKFGAGRTPTSRRPAAATCAVQTYGPETADGMPVPTCDPDRRDPADVAPAATYRRDDPVWVYRNGSWRPGVVDVASGRAVLVTYRNAHGRGTVVDTVAAECVLTRAATVGTASDPGAAA